MSRFPVFQMSFPIPSAKTIIRNPKHNTSTAAPNPKISHHANGLRTKSQIGISRRSERRNRRPKGDTKNSASRDQPHMRYASLRQRNPNEHSDDDDHEHDQQHANEDAVKPI